MVTIFQVFFAAILIWGPSMLHAAENGDVAMVKAIQLEEQDGVERVVIRLSGRVEKKIFELPGENPRLVCDLLHTGYPVKMRRVIPARGELVSRVRVGIHNKPVAKTRIVIDLVEDTPYSFEHAFREEDNSLILTLSLKNRPKPVAELIADLTDKKAAEPDTSSTRQEEEISEPAEKASAPASTADTAVIQDEKQAVDGLQDEVSVKKEGADVLQQDEKEHPEIVDEDIPVLLDVSFERNTNDKEMVLFRLSGFHPPVIFSTENEDLLVVCDFLDALLGYGIEPVIETEGKYIRGVRVSKHESPDKVRVVLDLVDKYNYDLKQVFFREDNLFVVVISNIGDKKTN